MTHEPCGTYFNTALTRCPHCGLYWCPRCRRWFQLRTRETPS
jgi:hypothetical protein